MDRRLAVLVTICGLVLGVALGGCGDDDEAEPPPLGDDRSSFVEVRERSIEVCRRAGGDADACDGIVDAAIDAAVAADCRVAALDAYLEVGIATTFAPAPPVELLETCPAPLASLALADPPDGYDEVTIPTAGVGLLDTHGLAVTFVEPDAVASYLSEIGHRVSYLRRWYHADDTMVSVRLDRFDDVAGARHFTASDPGDDADGSWTTIPGVDDGRIETDDFAADDGRERVRQQAKGRVCDVAITVVVHAAAEPWDERALEEMLVRQVHRVRAASSC